MQFPVLLSDSLSLRTRYLPSDHVLFPFQCSPCDCCKSSPSEHLRSHIERYSHVQLTAHGTRHTRDPCVHRTIRIHHCTPPTSNHSYHSFYPFSILTQDSCRPPPTGQQSDRHNPVPRKRPWTDHRVCIETKLTGIDHSVRLCPELSRIWHRERKPTTSPLMHGPSPRPRAS